MRNIQFAAGTLFLFLLITVFLTITANAQSTEFLYQGSLKNLGSAANGSYDFEFALFDALSSGIQLGSTLSRSGADVTEGVFAVKLDFGNQFPGASRFIEIRVRQTGSTAGFTTLSPRQLVNSSPYAVQSINAANAVNATNAVNALSLGGVAANQFVQTADSRLSDDRNPLPNSPNYIQNRNTQQTSSNFNISGNGTLGGTLSANVVNVVTQLSIGGNRILSNPGIGNLFAGVRAANSNPTGNTNSFFGYSSGESNTTGSGNSFFGFNAGPINQTGDGNSAFGVNAGLRTSVGHNNSFFGAHSGERSSGNNNTFLGVSTDVGGTPSNATAVGYRAYVTQSDSLVLGSIGGVNLAESSTNVGIGTTAPSERLHVVGNGLFTGNLTVSGTLNTVLPVGSGNYIQNTTTQQTTTNFNISGNGTIGGTLSANIVNAATQFDIGGSRILSNSGIFNLFAGVGAGASNTTGGSNAFFGYGAGQNNTTGGNNAFFGRTAGFSNTTGNGNAFFGNFAGNKNTTGGENAFFGNDAGLNNTTGNFNSFIGANVGRSNTTGGSNSFFGYSAGYSNTTGNGNAFFGNFAGNKNTTGGNNSFFGSGAGVNNTIGIQNAFFGANAGSNNTTGSENVFFGSFAGVNNNTGSFNSFFGNFAGHSNTTGNNNSFFGESVGNTNTTGNNNAFFGGTAGFRNTTGNNNTLLGANTDATDGLTNATAIGYGAFVTQSNSLILGSINGVNSATANTNVGIGTTAPANRLHIFANGGNVILGDPGCNPGFGGIGFASTLSSCSNYSLLGDGTNTIISRPSGTGVIEFRLGNVTQATINSGGLVSIVNLGAAGTTALCRNASNQISSCSSSARYKNNINPFISGMSLIKQLHPVSFNWKDGGMADMGLVAEEVNVIEPLLTTLNAIGQVEGVKYDRIGVVLVNAVKEQQAQIESQQKQIQQQQRQIRALTLLVCTAKKDADICKEQR